ncbi:MAG: ABC transporter permease [Bdellovibrionales bacterium]|nr:ABC transporter permease [Bdellovibrionales bacterium]
MIQNTDFNASGLTAGKSEAKASRSLADSWTTWVGFRYLKSKKNSSFLSFITFISIAGVALGVTAMIVVLSVMDGFERELRKRLMNSDLHILIEPTRQVGGFQAGYVPRASLDPTGIPKVLEKHPKVSSFWPMVSAEAILKTGRKVAGVVLKGVTPERLDLLKTKVTESVDPQLMGNPLSPSAGTGSARPPTIFVGQELAYELGIIPGDEVQLISPTEMEGPMSTVPRVKKFLVEGIYHSGLPDQEVQTIFSSEAGARSFLRKADVISHWEVTLSSFEHATAVADELKALGPQFRIRDYVELNSHLFASLKLERIAMFVILAFIVVVASFNIVTTLTLMVLEKKREISILKAMGASSHSIGKIFLSEGLLIGVSGVSLGVLCGFLICGGLSRYGFIKLPDIYYDRTLPVTFDYRYYVGIAISAFLIVLIACVYPSRRAASVDPLEGIRFG